jgi:hypothetical protein
MSVEGSFSEVDRDQRHVCLDLKSGLTKQPDIAARQLRADFVAEVVFHPTSKILKAAGAAFV